MASSPWGALARYRSLPRIASGAWMLLAVAARAPYAMIPLGALTAITASTGSVATGGLATGLISVSAAIAGPLIGRAADRAGRRLVLGVVTPLNAAALTLLLLAALLGWDGPTLWATCLATGATTVPVSSFARVRWIELAGGTPELRTALSYESTVDELSYVLGPALVGIAATAAFPAAPLVVVALLVAAAGIPFALWTPTREQTRDARLAAAPTELPERPAASPSSRPAPPAIPRVILAVVPALIVMLCIGAFFGAAQSATTERAALLGADGSAGLAYALLGLGSAIMALLVVLVPDSVSLPARLLVGGIGMALFIGSAALVAPLSATALTLLLAGLFIGPTMVTAFALADQRTPPDGTGVAMTSMASSVSVGQATGATAGGAIAASAGPGGAYALGVAVSVLIVVVSLSLLARRTR